MLSERYESSDVDEYETGRWTMADEQVREAGPHTYLLTYTLRQGDRVTRRLTVWQRAAEASWKALYHQGTIVS